MNQRYKYLNILLAILWAVDILLSLWLDYLVFKIAFFIIGAGYFYVCHKAAPAEFGARSIFRSILWLLIMLIVTVVVCTLYFMLKVAGG